MIVRSAYAYVRLLFALELLLLVASLLLHLSVFMGAKEPYLGFGAPLFRAMVVVGLPVFAFIKDSLRWVDQIKSCPEWMWKGALSIGVYGLLTPFLQALFPQGQSLMWSGFPLGFEAISLCILYSVLWAGYLEQSDVVRRASHSLVIVAVCVIAFLAYRAGYLCRPGKGVSWRNIPITLIEGFERNRLITPIGSLPAQMASDITPNMTKRLARTDGRTVIIVRSPEPSSRKDRPATL